MWAHLPGLFFPPVKMLVCSLFFLIINVVWHFPWILSSCSFLWQIREVCGLFVCVCVSPHPYPSSSFYSETGGEKLFQFQHAPSSVAFVQWSKPWCLALCNSRPYFLPPGTSFTLSYLFRCCWDFLYSQRLLLPYCVSYLSTSQSQVLESLSGSVAPTPAALRRRAPAGAEPKSTHSLAHCPVAAPVAAVLGATHSWWPGTPVCNWIPLLCSLSSSASFL